jgi:general secretion pathway protein H
MPILLVGKTSNQFKIGTDAGFTLLELLIVMAIIAMAAAVVVTRLSGTSELTYLKAEVRKTIGKLNYTRRLAIIEGKEKLLFFQKHKQATQATEDSTRIKWTWGGKFSNKAVYKITFYPEGGSSGGELSLSYLGHKAKIIVNPITGKVKSEILYE